MSCNGCRVLRKGCSDSCALRPCLQWIEGAEAQGHATVFVAKFFGRAGLMGFIAAVPENQRPALFRSLLYEACGRTVNPVYGAVGLLWSGNWHICQAAVETVLRGGSLKPPAGLSPSDIPCYGPMPNLPRLHVKSEQPHPEDVKRFKTFEPAPPGGAAGGGRLSVPSQQEDTKPQVLNRGFLTGRTSAPLPVSVKREREEAASEVIAPVARRPKVGEVREVGEGEECTIDLDLTLSSHPSTPQLVFGRGGGGGRKLLSETDNNNITNGNTAAVPAVVPPAAVVAVAGTRVAESPSNSFSSEGSVTSLDTGDFIASRNNVGCGMDLLQRMENRHHRHHQVNHHVQHLQKL